MYINIPRYEFKKLHTIPPMTALETMVNDIVSRNYYPGTL